MFRLNFDSLLSIVSSVRCIEVVTHKSLRNKGDRSGAAIAERLESFGSRKLDDVVIMADLDQKVWRDQNNILKSYIFNYYYQYNKNIYNLVLKSLYIFS